MSFDIPRLHAERAWFNTKGQSAEVAAEWYFTHMDDPLLNVPLNEPSAGGAGGASTAAVDPEAVMLLSAMGFPTKICEKALKETGGNLDRAADWLFSHPDEPMEEEKTDADAQPTKPTQPEAVTDGPGSTHYFWCCTHLK